MEIIDKKVLIKEAITGVAADRIFSVKNLPKSLLYDKNGTLLPGIRVSQTGDNGFVFERYDREGDDRLKTLDRYIDRIWTKTPKTPERIPNQSVPDLASSPALTKSQLEERTENLFGVRFLDLPIPNDQDVPSFESVSESKHVTKTFQDEDYFDPTQKVEKKMAVVEPEKPFVLNQTIEEKQPQVNQPPVDQPRVDQPRVDQPVDLKCVGCGFQSKNKQSLRMHLHHKHNVSLKKEAAISSG